MQLGQYWCKSKATPQVIKISSVPYFSHTLCVDTLCNKLCCGNMR